MKQQHPVVMLDLKPGEYVEPPAELLGDTPAARGAVIDEMRRQIILRNIHRCRILTPGVFNIGKPVGNNKPTQLIISETEPPIIDVCYNFSSPQHGIHCIEYSKMPVWDNFYFGMSYEDGSFRNLFFTITSEFW